MSNVPTNAYNENEGGVPAYTTNEGRDGVMKRTFHLGGSKYVIFMDPKDLLRTFT